MDTGAQLHAHLLTLLGATDHSDAARIIAGFHAKAMPEGAETAATPSSRWSANGEADPHGNTYDCERAALAYGGLTDDELANALFLCDHRSSFDSIGYLTAAKDRIRWLSRSLEAALAPQVSGGGDALVEGLARSVAELDPNEGRWMTCSGCYESEDGHPVGSYPHSHALNCTLGMGCHECGGLGAVWDTTNYADFAEAALAPQARPDGGEAFAMLVAVAKAAHVAMDDGEELVDHRVMLDAPGASGLAHALDAMDTLPDLPGPLVHDGWARAEYFARHPAPASDADIRHGLDAVLHGDHITISTTAETLVHAARESEYFWDAKQAGKGMVIVDEPCFVRDVLRELNREKEDGSTPISRMFDAAIVQACEQGSAAVYLESEREALTTAAAHG